MKKSFDSTPFDAPRTSSKAPLLWGAALLGAVALAFGVFRGSRGNVASDVATQIPLASTRVAKVAPAPTPTPTPTAPPLPSWASKSVITDVPVDGKKVVALTFDDGPWPHSTNAILKILRENNAKATFFMVGQEIARRPEVAKRARDAGHILAGHSFSHAIRPRDPKGEIAKTDASLKKIEGFTPTLYRPPYGIVHNAMTRRAQATGKAIILWSSDSQDWRRPGSARIVSNVLRQVRPGGIVLLHDGGGHRAQTIAALPRIISGLRARGYSFVTVPQLLSMRVVPKKAKPKVKKPSSAPKKRAASTRGSFHASTARLSRR